MKKQDLVKAIKTEMKLLENDEYFSSDASIYNENVILNSLLDDFGYDIECDECQDYCLKATEIECYEFLLMKLESL